jgi:hypothetical protein
LHTSHQYRLAKPLAVASHGLGSFFFPILRRGFRLQGTEQAGADSRYLFHRAGKGWFIRFRWFIEPADFSYELERRRPDFVFSDRRVEVKKRFDIPAHSIQRETC